MCAKLKCCLNYEVDNYIEASRRLPSREIVLQTQDSDYYLFKSDILAGLVTYSTDKKTPANVETITARRALAVIDMNKRGEKPLSLQEDGTAKHRERPVDLLENESLTRFDKNKKKKKSKNRAARQAAPKSRAERPAGSKPAGKQAQNKPAGERQAEGRQA